MVEWTTVCSIVSSYSVGVLAYVLAFQDFSADVTAAVTEDSRHKKLEAFADLAKAAQA